MNLSANQIDLCFVCHRNEWTLLNTETATKYIQNVFDIKISENPNAKCCSHCWFYLSVLATNENLERDCWCRFAKENKDLLVSHIEEIKSKYHKYIYKINTKTSQDDDSTESLKSKSTMLFEMIPNNIEIPETAKADKKFFRSRVKLQQISDAEPKRRTSHRFQILPCNIRIVHNNPYQPKGILLNGNTAKKKNVQWSDTLITYINPEESDSGEDKPKRKKMKPDNEAHPNKLSPQKNSDEAHPMKLSLRDQTSHNNKSYQEDSSDDEMSCDSSDESFKIKTKTKGALRSPSLRKQSSNQANILKSKFDSRYFKAKILLQPINDDHSNSLAGQTLEKTIEKNEFQKSITTKPEDKEDREIEEILNVENSSVANTMHRESPSILNRHNDVVDESPIKCSTPKCIVLPGLQKLSKVTINNSISTNDDNVLNNSSLCENGNSFWNNSSPIDTDLSLLAVTENNSNDASYGQILNNTDTSTDSSLTTQREHHEPNSTGINKINYGSTNNDKVMASISNSNIHKDLMNAEQTINKTNVELQNNIENSHFTQDASDSSDKSNQINNELIKSNDSSLTTSNNENHLSSNISSGIHNKSEENNIIQKKENEHLKHIASPTILRKSSCDSDEYLTPPPSFSPDNCTSPKTESLPNIMTDANRELELEDFLGCIEKDTGSTVETNCQTNSDPEEIGKIIQSLQSEEQLAVKSSLDFDKDDNIINDIFLNEDTDREITNSNSKIQTGLLNDYSTALM